MAFKEDTYLHGGFTAMRTVIDLNLEQKYFNTRLSSVTILEGFALTVSEGETVAIVGDSGVGKSSLLNILGLIDDRYVGSYRLFGELVSKLSEAERAAWRNQRIGFVLQESALISSLTIEENIKLPLLYSKKIISKEVANRFEDIVQHIGIKSILNKKPLECSGGEKARSVFARAIIMNPLLILADEPTASLDRENRERILNLLFTLNKDFGTTIITVTHDPLVAEYHNRIISLQRRV